MITKKIKFPSAYVILFSVMIFVTILTWIIPAGEYEKDESGNFLSGTYQRVENKPLGLWNIILSPVYGMLGKGETPGAITIALFILVLGGFLGIIEKTGSLSSGISSLLKKNRGKEKYLIFILMLFFAIGGTTYGMAEETLVFYPLLIPFLLSAGFDTITALGVILIGSGVGVIGSTINPFSTGVASQAAKIGLGEGIVWRILILVISLGISILYVLHYAMKIKKNPKLSYVAEQHEADLKYFKIPENLASITTKQKVILWIFVISFLIMTISLVPWSNIFPQFTFFETSLNAIKKIPILGALLGLEAIPIGNWYLTEITSLFLFTAIIAGIIYGLKEDIIIQSFINGASNLLGVAFIVGIARAIQVIMNDGKITATILYWSENSLTGMPKSLFGILIYHLYLVLSFFIPSTSGLASATMSIISPMADIVGVPRHVVVTAFQSANGLISFMAPTVAVMMGSLALAHVSYNKWLAFIIRLIGILFVTNIVIITLACILS